MVQYRIQQVKGLLADCEANKIEHSEARILRVDNQKYVTSACHPEQSEGSAQGWRPLAGGTEPKGYPGLALPPSLVLSFSLVLLFLRSQFLIS